MSGRVLAENRNVSMYPSDWQIVEDADIGDAGVSASLRRIVREWYAAQERAERLTDERAEYNAQPVQPDWAAT